MAFEKYIPAGNYGEQPKEDRTRETLEKLKLGSHGHLSDEDRELMQRQGTEKYMKGATGHLSEEEKEARAQETIMLLHSPKKDKPRFKIEPPTKTEKAIWEQAPGQILKYIENDINSLRPEIGNYWQQSNLQKKADIGKKIRQKFSSIRAVIIESQEETADPYFKGDLENKLVELEKVVSYIPGIQENEDRLRA